MRTSEDAPEQKRDVGFSGKSHSSAANPPPPPSIWTSFLFHMTLLSTEVVCTSWRRLWISSDFSVRSVFIYETCSHESTRRWLFSLKRAEPLLSCFPLYVVVLLQVTASSFAPPSPQCVLLILTFSTLRLRLSPSQFLCLLPKIRSVLSSSNRPIHRRTSHLTEIWADQGGPRRQDRPRDRHPTEDDGGDEGLGDNPGVNPLPAFDLQARSGITALNV